MAHAWCWAVALVAEFLRPSAPVQPEAPLHLQNDGLFNPGARGAFAVICVDTSDLRVTHWTRTNLPLGESTLAVHYQAVGYSRAGLEDLRIDFL